MLTGAHLAGARVRESRLRWPVPLDLDWKLKGRRIDCIDRRGKYLIFRLDRAALIIHLGMSGSLRLLTTAQPPEKHDHCDFLLTDGTMLRYRDPRRFGAIIWSEAPDQHPLIASLGIEPLSDAFDGHWLHQAVRGHRQPIKTWLMNAHVIVGVGNIYANESLFHAGIHHLTPPERLGPVRCQRLATAVRSTLERAISAGGSSLRDFVDGHGKPGYFQQTYAVYGREGLPCQCCGNPVRMLRLGGRATYFCPRCQHK